jgi:adenylosuccinate synthase
MEANIFLIAGLGFGDEGKGTTVDYLARRFDTSFVVRYNGGAQAAHNVVLPDGRHHTFSQFGSASFVPDVSTYLSRYMLVNPIALMNEDRHLRSIGIKNAMERLFISGESLVTTPFHISANRLKEINRGKNRHGSCGMGIGETTSDALESGNDVIRFSDLYEPKVLSKKLNLLRDRKREEVSGFIKELNSEIAQKEITILEENSVIQDCMNRFRALAFQVSIVGEDFLNKQVLPKNKNVIFEGAQGVLLDEKYGTHPYTTWTDITFNNAFKLLKGSSRPVRKLGITRSYMTRHGAGPMPSEDPEFHFPESHNCLGEWQGRFRYGYLDLVLLRYSISILDGIDALCMTHMDKAGDKIICDSYSSGLFKIKNLKLTSCLEHQAGLTNLLYTMNPNLIRIPSEEFREFIFESLGMEISIESRGPTHLDKSTHPYFRVDGESI